MSEGLPEGWTVSPLSELLQCIESGGRPKGGVKGISRGVPSIGGEHLVYTGCFDFSSIRYVPSEFAKKMTRGHIKKNDILVVKDGATTGKTAFVGHDFPFDEAVVNEHVFICRLFEGIEPRFVFRFLTSKEGQEKLLNNFQGSAQGGINLSFAPNTEIPFAPLVEQRRIVAKLEKLLDKVDTCEKRLAKIPVILKRFRQAVLAAACSGRLTADWRKDDSYENDLPADWQWIPLEELLPHGGIFDGPFGSNLKSSDYSDSGARVIRLQNVGHLKFFGEKKSFISREKYEALKKHTVGKGDIIFASFIDEEIRACLLPKLSTKAIAKADCFCLRPKAEVVDRQYLTYQLVSRESYDKLVEEVHGATRPRINTTQLRKLEVRMCPLPEQQEIVRRVEALFALADQIEARYIKAKAYVDKLTQSILAKAFRGELVPQNPNDEPASVLLERIRELRVTSTIKKKKGK